MKTIKIILTAVVSMVVISCNNSASTKDESGQVKQDEKIPIKDSSKADKDAKVLTATFTSLDPAVSLFMKSLVQNYLSLKNALINDNATDAASASSKMGDLMKNFDKSLLTTDQKKVYDDIEDDLKEHTEHIAKNKLEHQRDHFAMMSEDMYNLVKAFGAGITIYHDHCPMYKDGSIWLSETKEIRNPYYGEKMMTCGSVMEIFK